MRLSGSARAHRAAPVFPRPYPSCCPPSDSASTDGNITGTFKSSAQWDDLTCQARESVPLDAPEGGEAARDDAGQVLAVGGGLPVFAHRDERRVLPDLHLHLAGDALLLRGIAGVEPGGAQFLDLRARRPAVPAGLAVGPHRLVAERVGVRDRAVDHREEDVPAALVRRALIGTAADHGAEIHLLEIDVEAGPAQLIGADLRQIADAGHLGRRDDDDLFALVAG